MRSEALLIGWWGKQGRAGRCAVLTVAVPAALAVFVTAVSVLGARALVMLALRGAALMWRRAGVYGRLTGGMVLAWPAADVLRALGVLPRYHVVSMLFGAVVSGTFACAIATMRGRARRRWKDGRAMVLSGGWQDAAAGNAARIQDGQERIAELERHVAALSRALSGICEASGMNAPGGLPQRPHLRLVGDGTGPIPRISLPVTGLS